MEAKTSPKSRTAYSPKDYFLDTFEREHRKTVRVLRAFPPDKADMRPHPTSRSARELAWTFVMERGLGVMVFKNEFEQKMGGTQPEPPEAYEEILAALGPAQQEYAELIRATPEEELFEMVRFFTAPKTIGELSRLDWIWFLLHDEIHHRGQFSVYLRMAGGKVPSIYGPSRDEPFF